jgi:hypothetical protein
VIAFTPRLRWYAFDLGTSGISSGAISELDARGFTHAGTGADFRQPQRRTLGGGFREMTLTPVRPNPRGLAGPGDLATRGRPLSRGELYL